MNCHQASTWRHLPIDIECVQKTGFTALVADDELLERLDELV